MNFARLRRDKSTLRAKCTQQHCAKQVYNVPYDWLWSKRCLLGVWWVERRAVRSCGWDDSASGTG